MTRQDVITNILASYRQYGVTRKQVRELVRSGEHQGFSYQTIYTGLRMALGEEYGREELFTVEEVAEALGSTKEEVCQEIERLDIETVQAVGEPLQRTIIPPGGLLS